MRLVLAILAAALAISLSGCVIGAKPKKAPVVPAAPQPAPVAAAPAKPPEPLSIPQTQVLIPPPQPLDPDAFALPPAEPPPETTATPPRNRARNGSTSSSAPRSEAGPPVGPTLPAVEPRPPIEEVVPAAEQKRLQDSAQARKREINQWLETRGKKRLTRQQQGIVERIRAFLKDSDAAERRKDMREADAIAERAQILLRELQNGQ